MATVDVPLERIRFGQTKRRDLWWAMPLTTFIVFSSFVVYVTWALLQGQHYHYGNYLSPLYSPELFEVEFVSQEGHTYALTTVSRDQLLRLQFEPAAA